MNPDKWKAEKTRELVDEINKSNMNQAINTNLYTSDRVLARITDGIYRLPSSALRELICNAYDADATKVEIQTTPPSFDQITIQDNGNGMTLESLAYLIHNIGGSAKRTNIGAELNICSEQDPKRSPGGRKLIGKIGIGLFSVSQITKTFQIITKRAGDNFRINADVVLKTHSEEDLTEDGNEFVTGDVQIWKVPAEDIDYHGTRIVLRNILPKTKEHLRSMEIWLRCYPNDYESTRSLELSEAGRTDPPHYHIGRIDNDSPIIKTEANFPWDNTKELTPAEKMRQIVDSVYQLRTESKKPSIMKAFDNYFQMIWSLSLAIPVNYIEDHPFDLKLSDIRVFKLSNDIGGQAIEIDKFEKNECIRKYFAFTSPERGGNTNFRVVIDGIELLRPLKFKNLPKTAKSGSESILFVGSASPDLSAIPKEIRGGNLEFEGYLLWNSVITPKEHTGVLLRINDAAGTNFDDSFMKYPTSEIVRTNQVTSEIFVKVGLDAALNIDRESFNYSHPHYQYITLWLHNAFRQLSNKQKEIAKSSRIDLKNQTKDQFNNFMKQIVESIAPLDNDENKVSDVIFTDEKDKISAMRYEGTLAYYRSPIIKQTYGEEEIHASEQVEEKVKAIIQILDRMNLLDTLSFSQQQELVQKITAIISK